MAVYTPEGLEKLRNELEDLMTRQRPEVVQEIEIAKGFGDLSENAEYSAARERQARIEGRILELTDMIEHAEVLDSSDADEGTATIGSVVRVYDVTYEEEDEYKIVGASEANPALLYVSNDSPIGAKLIGCRVGDEIQVETPGGLVELRVLGISN